MLTGGFFLLEEIDGEPLVFLPHLRKAEDGIATKIKLLAAARVFHPKIDFHKAVVWCEERTGKTLAPSQREVLESVLSSRPAITGGSRCWQDYLGELDPPDPPGQENETPAVHQLGERRSG